MNLYFDEPLNSSSLSVFKIKL